MGKGLTTQTMLRMPMNPGENPAGAFAGINRWANGLPFGSVGFRVIRTSDDAAVAAGDYGITEYDTPLEDVEGWWTPGAATMSSFIVPRGLSGVYVMTSTHLLPTATADVTSFIQTNRLPEFPTNALPISSSSNASATILTSTAIGALEEGSELVCGIRNDSAGSVTPTWAGSAISQNSWHPSLTVWRISLL